jgi:PadR family transcriptional regulator
MEKKWELLHVPEYNGIDKLEEIVLLAVLRLGDDGYGVTIREEIERRTGRDLPYGTIYKVLDRLERRGFVSSRIGESTPARGGRAKRYFKILASGQRALNKEREAMDRLWEPLPAPSRAKMIMPYQLAATLEGA